LSAIESEVVPLLQRLIRFRSVNPPGDELPVAQFIDDLFKREGIDSRILIPADNRGIVIAKIPGDGTNRPVMLLAHTDVVSVEADKWSCDPFEGVIRDGYVYGRGAIDDKGMLAANIMTMLLLQRELKANARKLSRDIVFLATADEEMGGAAGMKWLTDNHREVLDVEFALNEGGRTRVIEGGKRYLAVQTAEKISHIVTLTARGPAGHAAIPRETNAIFRLGRALERLSQYSEPMTLTNTTRNFFGKLAEIWPDEAQREAMSALSSGDAESQLRAGAVLSSTPVFNAVLRDTISPTMLMAGTQGNVIPAEASVMLNVRTIPGHSVDDLAAKIAAFIGDEGVEVDVTHRSADAPASDENSAMFNAIVAAANALDPDMAVVPYLSTGATDSSALRRLGINAYGLLPFPMVQSDEERMHGHDERVPIASFVFGTRLIYESVSRAASRYESR
jgi:acetylornithine deacetylase/succinyl-diaminopimelate desuccinylase-like protein